MPPVGKRKKPFPCDLGELCLATAWRLVNDGQSVLVFCPVRAHVEPFAARVIDLHHRGALASLLSVDQAVLKTALTLGAEWLGAAHPILECLKLGVAIHHGALPTAFRKEVERLLREGILKVTISSPTLAQGLNLSATAVIIHSLFRNRERIKTSEFKNVVGRAGRAYVDVEGLVLYPIFDDQARRIAQWEALIADLSSREMESGLVRLLITLLVRMGKKVGGGLDQLVEYVVNNAEAWTFPEIAGESAEDRERAQSDWDVYLATLDTAILSLIGENDIADEDIPAALDDILQSSLWERRINRRKDEVKVALKAGLVSRSRQIWAQSTTVKRRGYFLAGIGLKTGHALDAIAADVNDLLISANSALLNEDADGAIAAITAIAERVFAISPFMPDKLPANWRDILRFWLLGQPIAAVAAGQEADTLQFVEGGLVYRLPWAMEAIRVRGLANGDTIGDMDLRLDDFELGLAVSAVETGTIQRPASILIQAGFSSRLAAIKAVNDTAATLSNAFELQQWLASDAVKALAARPDWPTVETKAMWTAFVASFVPQASSTWKDHRYWAGVKWYSAVPPPPGTPVRLHHLDGRPIITSADGSLIGEANMPLNPSRRGLMRAAVSAEPGRIDLSYLGPDDLWLA